MDESFNYVWSENAQIGIADCQNTTEEKDYHLWSFEKKEFN